MTIVPVTSSPTKLPSIRLPEPLTETEPTNTLREPAAVPPTTLLEPPPTLIDWDCVGVRRRRPVRSVPTRLPATSEFETGSVLPSPKAM